MISKPSRLGTALHKENRGGASTDKTMRGTNVMGATKRITEKLPLTTEGKATRLMAVRHDNVIGSSRKNQFCARIMRHSAYWLPGLLICLYPTASWLIPHADSSIYNILAVGGLIVFARIRSWPCRRKESLIAGSFFLFFLITFISWMTNGFHEADYNLLRRRLLFLFGITSLFWLAWRRPSAGFYWWGAALGSFSIGLMGLFLFIQAGNFRHGIISYTQVNPIVFGQFAVVLSAIAAASISWFYRRKTWLAILPVCGSALGLLAAVGSHTRGAWLVIPLLSMMLVWFYHDALRRNLGKTIAACLMLLFVLHAFSGFHILKKRIRAGAVQLDNYMEKPGNYRNSVAIRLQMWQAALEAGLKEPILGNGKAGYMEVAKTGSQTGKYHKKVGQLHFPHSDYATAFGYHGFLGLSALLAIFALPGWVFWKRTTRAPDKNSRAIAFTGLLVVVSYVFFSLTDSLFEQRATIKLYTAMILFALTVSGTSYSLRVKEPVDADAKN